MEVFLLFILLGNCLGRKRRFEFMVSIGHTEQSYMCHDIGKLYRHRFNRMNANPKVSFYIPESVLGEQAAHFDLDSDCEYFPVEQSGIPAYWFHSVQRPKIQYRGYMLKKPHGTRGRFKHQFELFARRR
ncbi:hypothetical protein 2 [Beihai rhabdo-like virus 5]|uniref:Uncharacterized protein n=1 Tax=Beihai rhabdo-like virus 5 TaxID=1922655 RepID=A0A1L3KMN5_9MONO|nr:hypothetical protein 2 [Beihai rhabdo-like virus 5]APG78647.1 hypothetical protein 2 [Beihai rhabdo-like virus 5]